jgi:hypothetical protein
VKNVIWTAGAILLPSFAGEVSPSYGDGGVVSLMALDPSVREDADTSPAELGRRKKRPRSG